MLVMVHNTQANPRQGGPSDMNFQEIHINLTGNGETAADHFPGKSERSVILAPGAMFPKESYHFLADRFQKLGIGSVCLNSGSRPNLLNAIAFLKTRNTQHITIIGASAGGAGVLFTLENNIDPLIDSVILLAPAGGAPLKSQQVKKLFIVAEHDRVSPNTRIYSLYNNSADPKLYEEIPNASEHAQHLFNSIHKEKIIQMMINFIMN
jgi:hypothetical protein